MNPHAAFRLSTLMSLLSSVVFAVLFARPWLQNINTEQALIWLVAPHMVRFIGLSFLVPGVVSESLPKAWAVPAGYGDFIAGVLATIATAALARSASWAIAAVWIFNVWGLADLLFAFYKRCTRQLGARRFGRWVLHSDSNRTAPIGVTRAHIRAADEKWLRSIASLMNGPDVLALRNVLVV
jgi:hypothetical protein